MDNKIFNVNGKSDEMLLKALELAFLQHGVNTTCAGWTETTKGLILVRYNTGSQNGNPFPVSLTAAQVYPIVQSWLKGNVAKTVQMEGWDADADHDGHNTLGWRVFNEDWGHVNGLAGAICCIKPAYMWHGK